MSPLALRFADFHGSSSAGIGIKGIYTINFPSRRGDFDTILFQKEKCGYSGSKRSRLWAWMQSSAFPGTIRIAENFCSLLWGIYLYPSST